MNDRVQKPRLLRFGTFELDFASGELRKGGALIKLQSQHFQLLALLA
jgi:DNA-binding response OmpR family regulator